jgi:hypothetical protein
MATSLGVTLAKTLTVEPLANAANELALQKVQALVIMGDNQDVLIAPSLALGRLDVHGSGLHAPKGRWVTCWRDLHTCPPNEIFRYAAGKQSKPEHIVISAGFDNVTDAFAALKHL